jgi:hypothetical protein
MRNHSMRALHGFHHKEEPIKTSPIKHAVYRHFLVNASSGMVRPRRLLANLGRLWAGGALACAILELESVSWIA